MKFRVARHTNDLNKVKEFYLDVMDFELLGDFNDHDGYEGFFVGPLDTDWHLEFTKSDESAIHVFDDDDLLVFYPENEKEFTAITQRIMRLGISQEVPKNPYWEENGIMIKDPDGFLIVIVKVEK